MCQLGTLDKYLSHLREVRGVQKRTLKNYHQICGLLPAEISADSLRSWWKSISGMKPLSQRQYKVVALMFLNWRAQHETDNNILKEAIAALSQCRPPYHSKLTRCPTEAQVKAWLNAPPVRKWWGLRDRVMLHLLYCTLRLSDAATLQAEDLHLDEGYILLRHSKRNREHQVPLPRQTVELLRRYLALPWKPKKNLLGMSGSNIRERAIKWAEAADIGRWTPHDLRRAAATHMYQKGAPLAALQELLGHNSPTTTALYIRLNGYVAAEAVKSFHPLR